MHEERSSFVPLPDYSAATEMFLSRDIGRNYFLFMSVYRVTMVPFSHARRRPIVSLNMMWLVPGHVGGSEDYAIAFVEALAATEAMELVVFCQPALVDAYPRIESMARPIMGPECGTARSARLLVENTWLQQQIRRLEPDVVHHLGGTIPCAAAARSSSTVLTVYDLQPLTHPERFDRLKRAWLTTVLPRSIRRADVICTLTRHVADQVVTELDIDRARLRVVPPGVTPAAEATIDEVAAVLSRYRLEGDLLLYPAITYPHKNHDVLIRSLPELLSRAPDATLVLTGRSGPRDAELDRLAGSLGVGNAVRRLGRLPKADLKALYEAATALVFPSIHEGFGLPLIEAMAHGTPVVAANASAIPEVVDGHGELLDPHEPSVWATTLADLLTNPARRRELAAASRRGAAQFTWAASASRVAAAYATANHSHL